MDTTTVPHAQFIKVWLLHNLPGMTVRSNRVILPPVGKTVVPSNLREGGSNPTLTWQIPFPEPFASPPFCTSRLCLQFIKASKQGHSPSQFRGSVFPLCCFPFCSSVSLIKCLEIPLGFPLNFYLGKIKNHKAGNTGASLELEHWKPFKSEGSVVQEDSVLMPLTINNKLQGPPVKPCPTNTSAYLFPPEP